MPRSPKNPAKPKSITAKPAPAAALDTPADRATSTGILVSKFWALVRKVKSHAQVVRDHVSSIGGLISDSVENDHLHKGAFGWWRKLDDMDALKRNEWLFHFDLYRERSHERWNAAPDMMPDRAEPESEIDEGERADLSSDQSAPTPGAEENRDLRPRHMRQPDAGTPADDSAQSETDQPSPSTARH